MEEGLKIWWVGQEVFIIDGTYRFCFQFDQDWEEEGGGHCVFKWILRGHLKPTPDAAISIMFEVISIKFW